MVADPHIAFVLGTGRCGSTLVHEVLARHPDVGFLSNLEDRFRVPPGWGRWNGPVYRSLPASFTRKGRMRFAPSEGYRAFDREISPAFSSPHRDLIAADATPWLSERTFRFFDQRARAQRGPLFLHKLTGWPRVGFLHAVFPNARFVHVVRDGRAVANSFVQMPWWLGYQGPERWGIGPLAEGDAKAWEASGRSFPLLAGLGWKVLLDAFDRASSGLDPERWLEVRYEDFVADPRHVTEVMLAFLGLEWHPLFDRGFARHRIQAGRTEAFRRDLAEVDLSLLDMLLGEHLAARGYAMSDDQHDDGPATDRAHGLG